MFSDKHAKHSPAKHTSFVIEEGKAKARKSEKREHQEHAKDEIKESTGGRSREEKDRGFVKVFSGRLGKSVRNTVMMRDSKGVRPDLIGEDADSRKHYEEADDTTETDFAAFLPDEEHAPEKEVKLPREYTPDPLIANLINLEEEATTEYAQHVRSIFEQDKFAVACQGLQSTITSHVSTIQTLCETNYAEFLKLEELKAAQESSQEIKEFIQERNNDLQLSGQKLIQKTQLLMNNQIVSGNINNTIELMNSMIFILKMMKKAKEYVIVPDKKELQDRYATKLPQSKPSRENKYYPAVKILDQLQNTHLKVVNSLTLGRSLSNTIPMMKQQMTKMVLDDVNYWFYKVRESAEEIGSFSLRQTVAETIKNEQIMKGTGPEISVKRDAGDITEVSVFDAVKLSFIPLYQAIHYFQHIGLSEFFSDNYRNNREIQKRLVLELSEKESFVTSFMKYFHEIAGFFIIESTISQRTSLSSAAFRENLWESGVHLIKEVVHARIQRDCTAVIGTDVLRQIKLFLLNFCKTLKEYGYKTHHFEKFIYVETRQQFFELASQLVGVTMKDAFKKDTFSPLAAKEVEEISLDEFAKIGVNTNKPTFPFSLLLPTCIRMLRQYITSGCNFWRDSRPELSTNVTSVEKLVELIIPKTEYTIHRICGVYTDLLKERRDLSIAQFCVAYINLLYLERAVFSGVLESHIIAEIKRTKIGCVDQVSHLKIDFSKYYVVIEEKVQESILAVIDGAFLKNISDARALELAPTAPETAPKEYIVSLMNELNVSIPKLLSALPHASYERLVVASYAHLAEKFYKDLQKPNLQLFNRHFARSFRLDLEAAVDQSSRSLFVGQSLHFKKATQLLHLLTSDKPTDFMNDSIREKSYNELTNYSELVTILQKFKEESGFFSGFSLFQDDKQKLVTTLIEWLQTKLAQYKLNEKK